MALVTGRAVAFCLISSKHLIIHLCSVVYDPVYGLIHRVLQLDISYCYIPAVNGVSCCHVVKLCCINIVCIGYMPGFLADNDFHGTFQKSTCMTALVSYRSSAHRPLCWFPYLAGWRGHFSPDCPAWSAVYTLAGKMGYSSKRENG